MSIAMVFDRLRAKLNPVDHDIHLDLLPATERRDPTLQLRESAVLVPLIDRGDHVTVLLTQRTAHLSSHAGQVSFPGGRIDPGDATAVDAALREAEEEVGLAADRVTVIGRLNTRVTGSNFAITPIVGILNLPFTLTPSPFEVAAMFEVPLSIVCDIENYREETMENLGRNVRFHVLSHDVYYIWGATARILREMAMLLALTKEELAAIG